MQQTVGGIIAERRVVCRNAWASKRFNLEPDSNVIDESE
jgi:hypothetical protein